MRGRPLAQGFKSAALSTPLSGTPFTLIALCLEKRLFFYSPLFLFLVYLKNYFITIRHLTDDFSAFHPVFPDTPLKGNVSSQASKGNLLLLKWGKEPLSPREMLTLKWSYLSPESGCIILGKAVRLDCILHMGLVWRHLWLPGKLQTCFLCLNITISTLTVGCLVRKQTLNLEKQADLDSNSQTSTC